MTSPEEDAGAPRIAVLGCGLIGTSIAAAAQRTGSKVRGFDPDPDVLRRSAEAAGLDPATSLAEAVRDADLVFVCAPVPQVAAVAVEALALAPDATVSDVASVKEAIVAAVTEAAPADHLDRFVGGHPMAGSERSGPEAASAAMLDDASWVLAPTDTTDPARTEALESWIRRAGARPVRLTAEQHDRVVAVVSHLPQVVSSALMNLAAREESGQPETLLLAAGGFRDLTRLAAGNPGLWAGILGSNRAELSRVMDAYIDELRSLREMISADDEAALEAAMASATQARRQLSAKPQVKSGVAVLQILVPDRPGVLAELTAALGGRGVNIEDFQIVHSPEGGRGSVQLTVSAATAEAASESLSEHGFDAVRIA